MPYKEIKNRLLEENDLGDEVRAFEQDGDRDRHIRRHVLPPTPGQGAAAPEDIRLGILLGLDLLRAWHRDYRKFAGVQISEPFLIVETEWLSGSVNAAPPEVYLYFAIDKESFEPLVYEEAAPRGFGAGRSDLEKHMTGTTTRYLAGEDEPDSGAWLFFIEQGAKGQ